MNQRFQCKWNARLVILIDWAEYDSAFSLNRGIQLGICIVRLVNKENLYFILKGETQTKTESIYVLKHRKQGMWNHQFVMFYFHIKQFHNIEK